MYLGSREHLPLDTHGIKGNMTVIVSTTLCMNMYIASTIKTLQTNMTRYASCFKSVSVCDEYYEYCDKGSNICSPCSALCQDSRFQDECEKVCPQFQGLKTFKVATIPFATTTKVTDNASLSLFENWVQHFSLNSEDFILILLFMVCILLVLLVGIVFFYRRNAANSGQINRYFNQTSSAPLMHKDSV